MNKDERQKKAAGLMQDRAVAAMLRKRSNALAYGPSVAVFIAFAGWMLIFGSVTDWLEPTWDPLGWLYDQGVPGLIVAIVLGYGIAILVAFTAWRVTSRVLLARTLERHRRLRLCLHCGYSLMELPEPTRCPECGRVG